MSGEASAIDRLSELVGIPDRYTDAFGQSVEVEAERRQGILAHLGFPSGSDGEAHDSLARLEAFRNGLVPKIVTGSPRRAIDVGLRPGVSGRAAWRLTDEAGRVLEGQVAGDGSVRLPALAEGYYRLAVQAGAEKANATVIVAPERCWQPGWMARGGRAWGLAAQIYSFRSASNLGIGSYADVAEAASGAGPLGASFLGLSPVHALFSADRAKTSPYSPSSRLFLETIHIDPKAISGIAAGEVARLLAENGRGARIAALRDAALADHAAVWAELSPVLEALWRDRREARDNAFEIFRREGGAALEAHATFETLHEHFRGEGRWSLGDWPEDYRNPSSQAVRALASEKAERVGYHAWLQYLADSQLAAAADAARAAGMSLGLYRDLAVGSDRGGSELWSHPERFGNTLSIGAPPDLLAPQGQDWGLPPLNPIVLEEQGLAAFRDLVRANMRHAGAIRIDHAFQLQRLYLIPVGEGGAAGAYVEYPFEAMLAVLRLESHRAEALVIAEDLGTAPEGFSDAIMQSGLLSYRVLAFERTPDQGFKGSAEYPRDALTVITTHDLPTFVGWWHGLDTDLRQNLGIYDPERAEKERGERVVERSKLTEALCAEKLVASPEPPDVPPFDPVLRFLARTPSALNAIQYEDVLGSRSQPNMPGTTEGHPNWRRKLDLDIAEIDAPGGPLAKVAAAVSGEGRGTRATASPLSSPPPRATYRFQFHKDFTFDDAVAAVPYLKKLGISHVYSSPIATARPGSTHGYDIVDPSAINPELGGEDGFRRLSDALKEHGLGLILDVVPNHLGVGGADNPWWLSALEWGQLSPRSRAFDIDWERLGANGKLIIPVLGDRYGDALEKGDLKLSFDEAEGSFSVWHHEHRLPITPLSYPLVLDRALAALDALEGHSEVIAVSDRLRSMTEEVSPERRAAFPDEAEALKGRLAAAVAASGSLRSAIERAVAVVNGVPGLPESFGTLHRMLEMQSYRPAHWRVAASDINYRRFFDINGLGGVRVELPDVFDDVHALVFRLVREGRVQGLRIDHIDGLADPEGYVRALQAAIGPGFYIVVEKILEPGEPLRPWPIAGTTGYDVLNLIDGVFVDAGAAGRIEEIYRGFTGVSGSYEEQLREAKSEILQSSFASELEVLASDLKRIADGDRRTRDYTVYAIRIALTEIVTQFPVYRSYIVDEPSPEDVELIETTVAAAKRASRLPDRSVHDFAAGALLGRIETEGAGRPAPDHVARFRRRFQQLTGPVMAKSLEDTLFYRYVPLISLNEVGGDPGHFGLSPEKFHQANAERAAAWPHAMIATATHDTKRGEDARARLSALSELPDEWRGALESWRELTGPHLSREADQTAPDANDQYMLLQSILGALPFELLEGSSDEAAFEIFRTRLKGFAEKALREAKRHTSWTNSDAGYEKATAALIDAVVSPGNAVLASLQPLAKQLALAGAVNGLGRTVLKCTLPGVPDIYQGTGFWDLSLVDPDNRRPVDYAERERALERAGSLDELVRTWSDGRIKQHVLTRLLLDRTASPELYADGSYEPLGPQEPDARVLAFRRARGGEELVVAVARLAAGLGRDGELPTGDAWGEATLALPAGSWRSVLDDRDVEIAAGDAALRELFAKLPVSVLRRTV